MKIHKGDMVLVISGPDKGAKGKVIQAFPKTEKVLVEGVNRIKKHVANSAPERGAESGGIVTRKLQSTFLTSWFWTPTVTQPAWATASMRTARRSVSRVVTGRTSNHERELHSTSEDPLP